MTDVQQRAGAKNFAAEWRDRGDEKSETQTFWISLLRTVIDLPNAESDIVFEKHVQLDNIGFIDGYIPSIPVLIEQKSLGIDLRKKYKQSDGTFLTAFEQAKRYADNLGNSERPRYIITCNFASFLIYDMEHPHAEPEELLLADLPKEYYRLAFLKDLSKTHFKREMELSIQAGEIVGALYDAILKHYKDPESPETLKSLNALCVRIVFCLYAEDAGIFGEKNQFHDYLVQYKPEELRRALIDLFKVLDTKPEKRDPYLIESLAAFPYVNGGLFRDEAIEIPLLDAEVRDLLLTRASDDFDWSGISPTIFGGVFESTLNPETRRSGGMHYTSIENIHKIIDPLFLNDLRAEFADIRALKVIATRRARLAQFQEKLAGLTFLDPACGSGNFLTETYLSLRRLENEVISLRNDGEQVLNLDEFIKVGIRQFYGIEINDFAVTVAKTALWIAESQMMKATEDIVHTNLNFLPLKSYTNIVEANALRLDWQTVIPKEKLSYIMGNPPFVGYTLQSSAQGEDMLSIYVDEKGKPYKTAGKIDFVAAWYFKASQLMQGTSIHTAFVSTNSITQGEQVASVWKPLYDRFGIHIDFAHQTFRWDSEASVKAHVHCVIVGFSTGASSDLKLFDKDGKVSVVSNINPYLIDAPTVFIESRNKALCNVPAIRKGNQPTDGGHFYLNEEERNQLISSEPLAEKFIHRIYGSEEYINNKVRYCLWLVGAKPDELRKMPSVMKRVEAVRDFRLASTKEATRKSAITPTLFQEIRHPKTNYIIVPSVSSERRQYVPVGFLPPDIIANNLVLIIPDATLYHLGVLTSNVHMDWMRAVCGRLESRYRYSNNIVYNNFPWPEVTEAQKAAIETTAQAILDARALYPESSLADLYNELTMPPELRKAHQANDRAVMKAYGFAPSMTEPAIVAELMKRYQALVNAGGTACVTR